MRHDVDTYRKANCSDRLRYRLADFSAREMASRRLSTTKVAALLKQPPTTAEKCVRFVRSRRVGDLGWERLLRLVEVLGYDVDLVIAPREQRRAAA